MGRFRKFTKRGMKAAALALGAALTLGMAVSAPQAAMAADNTAVLGVKKTASATTIVPGETMTYTVEVSCSTLTALGCVGASFADSVPAEFEILSATVANATPKVATIDGQNVTVAFDEDLGDGTIGLVDNADAVITITVKLREDLPHEANGVEIPNTATVDADNAEKQSSTAVVTPNVTPQLSTEAKKSFAPSSGLAAPGTETTLSITGANKSNGTVDSLTLTDPVDPSAEGNPFEYLAFTGAPEIVWPEGAVTATIEYWDGNAWVSGGVVTKPGAANAPPGDPKGVRVTFTAAEGQKLPQGATGGLNIPLEQRENVTELPETTALHNVVQSEVGLGSEKAQDDDNADYTISTEPIQVGAKKSFEPNVVLPGQPSR